jgi:hypothetical protein
MRNFKTVSTLTVLTLTLCVRGGWAGELKLDGQAAQGYDSNPLRLSDVVGARGGTFTDFAGSADVDHKFGSNWFAGADAGLSWKQFYSDVRDATERNVAVRGSGGLHLGSPVAKRRSTIKLAVGWRMRDATYVSPSTGEEAASQGESIGDRYDTSSFELDADAVMPVLSNVDATVEVTARKRDYRDDYEDLELEPLDYTQYGIEPGARWKDAQQRARLTFPVEWRKFRDRRARDGSGTYLEGTDLAYRYHGIDARYERIVTQTISAEARLRYQALRDSEGGYYDRRRWNASAGAGMDFSDRSRGTVDVAYGLTRYDRVAAGDEDVNEEPPDGRNWSVGLSYASALPIWGLGAYAQARWSIANSATARFDNERWQLAVGVRKAFRA